jgi:diguanylate cyclase (GGDEF)-like protein/PAS domain S-box-containing protein
MGRQGMTNAAGIAMAETRPGDYPEGYYRAIFDRSPLGMAVVDQECRFRHVNAAFGALVGYEAGALHGMLLPALMHPMDAGAASLLADQLRAGPAAPFRTESRFLTRSRDVVVLDLAAAPLPATAGGHEALLLLQLPNDRQLLADQLQLGSSYDALTSLPNAVLFMDYLGRTLAAARRRNAALAVLIVDVDRFAAVNEMLGYGTGDALLAAIARRLAAALRGADVVARLEADAFAVSLTEVPHETTVSRVAERILASLRQPFTIYGQRVLITTSVGMTYHDPATRPLRPQVLTEEAWNALHRAKAAGGGRIAVFGAA